MRALKNACPRLRATMEYETRGRRLILQRVCVRLFKFRTRTMGLNQIRTVWAEHLRRVWDDAEDE